MVLNTFKIIRKKSVEADISPILFYSTQMKQIYGLKLNDQNQNKLLGVIIQIKEM